MDKDYVCGCGKAYGSYPAFSTHRKMKHNNQTVQGTVMPQQGKAKRGRPSYDFKKIPKSNQTKKMHYQGLNVIETGLLQLEQQYKGKILSDPYDQSSNDHISELQQLSSQDQTQNQRIQALIQFAKLAANHTKTETTCKIIQFICQFIQFGIQSSQIMRMQVYNSFFNQNKQQLQKDDYGIKFYMSLCIMMTKWLYVVGKSNKTLKIQTKRQPNHSRISRSGEERIAA